MDNGTFTKVEKSEKTMYGPRAIVACGYTKDEQTAFRFILKSNAIENIPIKFPGDTDGPKTLKILLEEQKTDDTDHSSLRRAVIMSGLTQTELHHLMGTYRESGLPYPLWASLTPISESWTLKDLLETLAQEAIAMKRR